VSTNNLSVQSRDRQIPPSDDQPISPFDSIRRYRVNGSEYWRARELMKLMGYRNWQNFEISIKSAIENLELNGDIVANHFLLIAVRSSGRDASSYELTRYAAYMVALCCDGRKPEVARAKKYFATKTREAEVVIPQQSDQLLILKLENENLRLINENIHAQERMLNRQDAMITMHGAPVVLALAGKSDQLIKQETIVTEVHDLDSDTSTKILTAEQLKTEVSKRTGQKLKSLKWFADELRKLGRDDLLVPVRRSQISEYPIPEKLDEAIAHILGSPSNVSAEYL
jgi:hypothetical protein